MVTMSQNIYKNSGSNLDCIWIGSSIIEDKLCNREFDCENCPLDKVLKNLFSDSNYKSNYELQSTTFLDNMINRIEETSFDPKLIYLRNNLVVKNIYANIFYLGLNPLITNLLENIVQVKEYMRKVYFVKDEKILSIEGEWGNIAFQSSINFLLLDKLDWSSEGVKMNKWIALVAINQNELSDNLISHNQLQTKQTKILNMLKEYKECCLIINSDFYDNNEKIRYFYQLIGNDEYVNIINNINADS